MPREFPGSSAIAVTEGGRERFAAKRAGVRLVLCSLSFGSVSVVQEEKPMKMNQ